MSRRTRQTQFADLVQAARRAIPDVSITTDMIVGFPGETSAEFNESLAFTEAMAFARLHIFRYSRRAGTVAARIKEQVPTPVIQERSQQLHRLNADLEHSFRKKFIGRSMPVLWESDEPYGFGLSWSGLTGNYLRVVTQTGPQVNLRNQVLETQLVDLSPGALQGRLPLEPAPAGIESIELLPVLADPTELHSPRRNTKEH